MLNKQDTAAIIVDVQNAFMPTGSLSVADGDEIVPIINKILPCFGTLIFSKDWHPDNHVSFAESHKGSKPYVETFACGQPQMLFPKHAVQGTVDADFHPALDTSRIDKLILKGQESDVDCLSAFQDDLGRQSTGLAEYLTERCVKAVFIMGLTFDYCVKYTALDAVKLCKLPTYVVMDATKAANSDRIDQTSKDLEAAGVEFITSHQLTELIL